MAISTKINQLFRKLSVSKKGKDLPKLCINFLCKNAIYDNQIFEGLCFANVICYIYLFWLSACWSHDTHERPSFKHILKTLDDIARSKFQEMPGDNFYSLQDDWKVEIDEMLEAIRFREQVNWTIHLTNENESVTKGLKCISHKKGQN